MSLIDFVIIYLACGAPFGVHRFTARPRDAAWRSAGSVLLAFTLWPVFALRLVAERFIGSSEITSAERLRRLEDLRLQLEQTLYGGGGRATALFEFRDVFYRYFGLREAVSTGPYAAPHELFRATGHPDIRLASECLARKNHRRLTIHTAKAEAEFVQLLTAFQRPDAISAILNDAEVNHLATLPPDVQISSPFASVTTL